jgi:hypothetical protein
MRIEYPHIQIEELIGDSLLGVYISSGNFNFELDLTLQVTKSKMNLEQALSLTSFIFLKFSMKSLLI